jgi:S1-C subfamily serine protease
LKPEITITVIPKNFLRPITVVSLLVVVTLMLTACTTTQSTDQHSEDFPSATIREHLAESGALTSSDANQIIDSGRSDLGVLTTPELVHILTPSVVEIAVNLDRGQGVGTGVIFDENGHILTNWHVVEGASTITVAFEDGTIVDGELFRRDPLLDLAIIRVEQRGLVPALFGDSDSLQVGEDVIAIGHALGLDGAPTVSKGVVSALNRTILDNVGGNLSGLVQTDAAINEGNSGGPLVNMRGEVVGINTVKINSGDRLGFSININDAKNAAETLIALGPLPPPGFLGVGGVDVNRALARAIGLPVAQGFLITMIKPGSPAETAGLEPDDIIFEMDNVPVTNGYDLTVFLREHPSGSRISITVVRGLRSLFRLEAVLGDRPGS